MRLGAHAGVALSEPHDAAQLLPPAIAARVLAGEPHDVIPPVGLPCALLLEWDLSNGQVCLFCFFPGLFFVVSVLRGG